MSGDSPLIDPYVPRLERLDSCAISDALDSFGLSGAEAGLLPRTTMRRIVGRAVTLRLVALSDAPRDMGPAVHLGADAIMLAGPQTVIVIEQRTGIEAGCWGGILSLGATLRGVAGVIADGPVRDVDEAIHYDLPIFSRAMTACTARGRIAQIATNGTVRVGETFVAAGDYVLADRTGVVFIAAADIDRVVIAAESIAARESAMAQALRDGADIRHVMGAAYEHMLR